MIKNIAIQLDGYRSKRRQTKTAITKTATRKKGDIPRRFGCFQNGDKSKSATKPKRQHAKTATYPADLVVSKTATNQKSATKPKRRHAKTATYPADLVVSKTATNQNRRQNQNGNTPKRRQIQLDFSPKGCVDLYPEWVPVKTATTKTATTKTATHPT